MARGDAGCPGPYGKLGPMETWEGGRASPPYHLVLRANGDVWNREGGPAGPPYRLVLWANGDVWNREGGPAGPPYRLVLRANEDVWNREGGPAGSPYHWAFRQMGTRLTRPSEKRGRLAAHGSSFYFFLTFSLPK
jgi:hypothetical protein